MGFQSLQEPPPSPKLQMFRTPLSSSKPGFQSAIFLDGTAPQRGVAVPPPADYLPTIWATDFPLYATGVSVSGPPTLAGTVENGSITRGYNRRRRAANLGTILAKTFDGARPVMRLSEGNNEASRF